MKRFAVWSVAACTLACGATPYHEVASGPTGVRDFSVGSRLVVADRIGLVWMADLIPASLPMRWERVRELVDVLRVATVGPNACVLDAHHSVWCWRMTAATEPAPCAWDGPNPRRVVVEASDIGAYEGRFCALMVTGELRCWGGNEAVDCREGDPPTSGCEPWAVTVTEGDRPRRLLHTEGLLVETTSGESAYVRDARAGEDDAHTLARFSVDPGRVVAFSSCGVCVLRERTVACGGFERSHEDPNAVQFAPTALFPVGDATAIATILIRGETTYVWWKDGRSTRWRWYGDAIGSLSATAMSELASDSGWQRVEQGAGGICGLTTDESFMCVPSL